MVLVLVAALAVFFRRAGVWIGPHGLRRRGMFSETRHSREDLGEAILATGMRTTDRRLDATFIVLDRHGARATMFVSPYWSPEQMETMASALNLSTWRLAESSTFKDINDRHPGAAPFMWARPWAFAVIVTVSAFVVALLGFGVVAILGWPR